MKKNTLIQLILISAGITTFLSGFTYFVPRLFTMVSGSFSMQNTVNGGESYLTLEIVRMVVGLLLVLKSEGTSEFIANRSSFDDSLKIYTKPSQLFSILLIIIAIADLINHVPFLLNGIILFFAGTPADRATTAARGYSFGQWTIIFCHIATSALVIIFCPALTPFFLKNIVTGENDIIAEHETVMLETEAQHTQTE